MADNPNADAKADPKADPTLKLQADARAADAKAIEAQAKADEAKKSDEQKAADKARADADLAKAKAAEEQAKLVNTEPMTAGEAKVAAPVDPSIPASSHYAQKFGNDPRNPKLAPGLDDTAEARTVKLSRVTPDSADPVYTAVHPDMVGDYLRAGWNVA